MSYMAITIMTFYPMRTFLFQIVGIGILVPGILFLANVSIITDEIKPVAESVSFSGITLESLLSDVAIVFVCVGAFVLLVAGLGLFGACCGNRCLLGTVCFYINNLVGNSTIFKAA